MTGKGDGVGFTLNIPMNAGAGDPEYLGALSDRVIPAIDDFKPEFVLISAGFDGHLDDPLSGTRLTSSAYGEMTKSLKDCAARHCNGRIVSFLEGGYNLAALAESVEEHLIALTA
jgi:acetoin utilization deacetylase AcuC-like enzyme